MNKKTKISYMSVIVLTLTLGLVSFAAVAKNDNAKNDKSNKSSQAQTKSKNKVLNLKNFAKPDITKGETNAMVHKEKSMEVAKDLETVAKEEKNAGNAEMSNQVHQAAIEQVQTQQQATDAIEQVEAKGQVVKFILGPDYKNLGQLRSALVHNRNEIRRLIRAMNLIGGTGNLVSGTENLVTGTGNITVGTDTQSTLQAQLETLMQERERMRTIIYDNQDTFSLFGWVSKIMTGYVPLPANDPEETALTNDVENTINNSSTDTTDAGITAPTAPTIPTTGTTATQ